MKKTLSIILVFMLMLTSLPMEISAVEVKSVNKTIAAGYMLSFAIKEDGSLWAWGSGQLINNTNEKVTKPVKIMTDVAAVETNGFRNQALKKDGSLWAWGYVGFGENESYTTKPVKIMDGVVSMSMTSAIKKDGSLWVWGYFVGDGTNTLKTKPVKIMNDVIFFSTEGWNNLAIKKDGSLWAWGENFFGQIGDGTYEDKTKPVKIMDDVVSVSQNEKSSFAIKSDGSLWGWGDNTFGRLGDGKTNTYTGESNVPVKIMDNAVSVEAEGSFCFVVKTDGSLWSWGDDGMGVSIDGIAHDKFSVIDKKLIIPPIKIMDNVVSVSSSVLHCLAVKADGSLWALGQNGMGEVGDGTSGTYVTKPVKVMSGVKLPSGVITTALISNKPSSWAEAQVNETISLKLVPQSLQSKYTQATTRAEFCALAVTLYETLTGKEIKERVAFNDTTDVNVEKAAAIGVTSGTGDGKFSPNNNLTREQAAVMLSSLAKALGSPLTEQAATFDDNNIISIWAVEGVGQVQASGIMSGVGDNKFAPKNLYTREQSIVTIKKLYDMVK